MRIQKIVACIVANLIVLLSMIPTNANAASSSEIRSQINALKKEKEEIQEKIADVQAQYQQNSDEIADIIARKNVIDQEVQLFPNLLEKNNMRRIRFQDLRHSCRESFVCQWREPEGDSGVAGTQRYFRHIQHLHPSEFRFQGCFCQCDSRNLPGLRKGVPSDCPPDF